MTDELNKDPGLTGIAGTGGGIKIGGSSLHKRVAAQPLPPRPAPLVVQTQPDTTKPDANAQAQLGSGAAGLQSQGGAKLNPFNPQDFPNRIGMMLDCSGSMSDHEQGKSKMSHLKEAIANFIQNCDFSNTAIAIETFPDVGSKGDEIDEDYDYEAELQRHAVRPDQNDPLAGLLPNMPPAPRASLGGKRGAYKRGLTNIASLLQVEVSKLQPIGGTPMSSCISRTIVGNSLSRGILVSDGDADSAQGARYEAEKWVQAKLPIDTVHIGTSPSGEQLLKDIAAMTGGMFFKFDNVANFAKSFKFLTPAFRGMLTSGNASEVAKQLGAKEVK